MSENIDKNHILKCNNHYCKCKSNTAVQSLDEIDFLRGIWHAAQYGDLNRVRQLIESNKYDVNQTDSAGYTALHYAARNGHCDVSQYLIEKSADINATTRAGLATALHRACSTGKTNIVVLLLSKNANAYLKDADGKTALERAFNSNHFAICKLILDKYADINNTLDDNQRKAIFS